MPCGGAAPSAAELIDRRLVASEAAARTTLQPIPPPQPHATVSAELSVGTRLLVRYSAFEASACRVVGRRVVEGVRQHELRFDDEPIAHWMVLEELTWERVRDQ